ncbi:rhodanese domain-containing protein CG4456-like, partial [Teleopsis dalmanni]|uniref:rhodanese domain-containing protein CG4456-like n=1 Tax=Teleopsis dalmanni TaxID=139649 RepID=UPI0018CD16CD
NNYNNLILRNFIVHCPNKFKYIGSQNSQNRNYCTNNQVKIAEYEEIKELPTHPEKLLIDVREAIELSETGKIPTSINIPLGIVTEELSNSDPRQFKAKYGRDKPRKCTEIIFSCKSGVRAQKAAEAALSIGYKNIKNYKGSWLDWNKHENPNQ